MGQNHSQPTTTNLRPPTSPPDASATPTSPASLNGNLPFPRRRTPGIGHGVSPRKRMSAFLRGKRPESAIEPIHEASPSSPLSLPGLDPAESGPSVLQAHETNKISVPPLAVKSRSLKRIFQRRSWAPPANTVTNAPRPPHDSTIAALSGASPQDSNTGGLISSDTPQNGLKDEEGAPDLPPSTESAALVATETQPSLATSSAPPDANGTLDSPVNTPSPSSDKAITIRDIAMLSGTQQSSPEDRSESPSLVDGDVALTPVILDEDPAAARLSRTPSCQSLSQQIHDVIELDPPGADEIPVDVDAVDIRPQHDLDGGVTVPSTVGAESESSSASAPAAVIPPEALPTPSLPGSLPTSNPINDLRTSQPIELPPAPGPQHVLASPLPIIPAGTTMIIQGVVQAAEERTPTNRRNTDDAGSSNTTTANTGTTDRNASQGPNAHAHLDGTFAEPAEGGSGDASSGTGGQDPDSPNGAAELLGALLIAAASATANMLLSDPPGSHPSPHAHDPPPYASGSAAGSSGFGPLDPHPLNALRGRSSVGIGPRPRGRAAAMRDDDQFAGDRFSRPRSMMGNLRDRMFGNGGVGSGIGPTGNDEDMYDRILRALSSSAGPVEGPGPRLSRRAARNGERAESPFNDDAMDAMSDPSRDPIESLRERIANELMRALAARDGGSGLNGGAEEYGSGPMRLSPSDEFEVANRGALRDSGSPSSPSYMNVSPLPSNHNPADHLARMPFPGPMMSSFSSSIGPGAVPLEGSFERFLHDTNAELRSTLLERMNNRDTVAVPIPVPTLPSHEDGATVVEQVGSSAADEEDAAGTSTEDRSAALQPPVRLVHRAPEGVIEPRLNWWRMHRFPPRTVATPPSSDSSEQTTVPPSPTSSSFATPASSSTSTASPADASNIATAPSTSSSGGAAPNTPGQTILIPVIVVGIRTAPSVLVQEIGALASAPSTNPTSLADDPITSRRHSRRRSSPRNSSDISAAVGSPMFRADTAAAIDRPSRPSWSRAVDSLTRAIANRRRASILREMERSRPSQEASPTVDPVDPLSTGQNGTTILPASADETSSPIPSSAAPRDRTRNYLIWVIGGYYPETHPILTTPNLLLNQIDQDDFWGLAELLGQVKPPVASKSDIDRAGLEIVKASELSQREKDGRVTSNTSERCLICLSDYEPEEDLRILSCKHVFHQECVDKWLEVGRNNCPACRTKGVEVSDTRNPEESRSEVPSSSA